MSAYAGRIEADRKILLSTKDRIYPQLEIGDSGSILEWHGSAGEEMFHLGNGPFLVARKGDQVLISTVIRSKDGRAVAEIVDNEWKINPSNSWDRNYSKNALEVRDQTGDVVLQVRLVEDRVQFQAKMYASNGNGIAFVARPDGAFIEARPPGTPLKSVIKPMFRYPSELHLGEMEGVGTAPGNGS